MSLTIRIPLFVVPPPRITYYSLSLEPERCPSWHLHYAFENHDLCLSPAFRPCDFRNDKHLMVRERELAEELARYAEPIMQRRYGAYSSVEPIECSCPESLVKRMPFNQHEAKARALLAKLRGEGATKSLAEKRLPVSEVVPLEPHP